MSLIPLGLLPLVEPLGFGLPGECSDWLLCRRIVGSRATNDALCLKLEDARLISDFRFVPQLNCFGILDFFFWF